MKRFELRCDICKKEIEDGEEINRITLQRLTANVDMNFQYVCPKCLSKTYKYIEELAKEKEQ